jgi:hypothetical protein
MIVSKNVFERYNRRLNSRFINIDNYLPLIKNVFMAFTYDNNRANDKLFPVLMKKIKNEDICRIIINNSYKLDAIQKFVDNCEKQFIYNDY